MWLKINSGLSERTRLMRFIHCHHHAVCCCFRFCYFNCLASSNKRNSHYICFKWKRCTIQDRDFPISKNRLKAFYSCIYWIPVCHILTSLIHKSVFWRLFYIPETQLLNTIQMIGWCSSECWHTFYPSECCFDVLYVKKLRNLSWIHCYVDGSNQWNKYQSGNWIKDWFPNQKQKKQLKNLSTFRCRIRVLQTDTKMRVVQHTFMCE